MVERNENEKISFFGSLLNIKFQFKKLTQRYSKKLFKWKNNQDKFFFYSLAFYIKKFCWSYASTFNYVILLKSLSLKKNENK
jgi:hypothetical protein